MHSRNLIHPTGGASLLVSLGAALAVNPKETIMLPSSASSPSITDPQRQLGPAPLSPSAAPEMQWDQMTRTGLFKDFERSIILTPPIGDFSCTLPEFAEVLKDYAPEQCEKMGKEMATFFSMLRERVAMRGLSRLPTSMRGLYWQAPSGLKLSIGRPTAPILPGGSAPRILRG